MIRYLLIITVLFLGAYSSPVKRADPPTCQACHPVDPDKINVHLIPHSHDDVGWLKTVDQYYYGSQSNIQKAGVQYIISSTVEALKANPDRRFVQVETAFFWKWWQHQSDSAKQDFIDLVNNGQLEIINAAWSMNDEAATNYQSIIDQFTWGLRTINDTIGKCGVPRVGWQIDPFGHSREQASIFYHLGFDGVFFARIDYQDREQRILDKNMEIIWKGSANLDKTKIFTNIFPEFYYPPSGYCFDIECGDEVLNDDQDSPDFNIPRKVEDFGEKMEILAGYYQTSNLLIPMGGDFQYQAAEKNFINMDRLIAAFENHKKINLIYSTPSCYIKAVNDEATAKNVSFTLKTDDFFPYGSDSHCYWTGYFTSRPNAKRFERTANNFLQAAKQLTSFYKVEGFNLEKNLTLLKQAMGILQHHDAITGTAKQAVAKDYMRLLTKGIQTAEPVVGNILINLLAKNSSQNLDNITLTNCLMANVSICEVTTHERFMVFVYNPLERPVDHYVRLPVPDGTFEILGSKENETVDIFESISSFTYINEPNQTPLPNEMVFLVENLPPFGIEMFYIQQISKDNGKLKSTPQVKFGSETTGFEIDEKTGLLKSVTMNGITVEITQQFLYYSGANGDNSNVEDRASGAYIFRPIENQATVVSDKIIYKATVGNLVDEVHQTVNEWITQIIRVYKGTNDNYIEFDWLVGPIEVDEANKIGREIVSRFTIKNFNNSETFYTDSNGREMIERHLNKRYDYKYNATLEPIASNYYPVTSKIVIKDENRNVEVAVLTDRAQGGTSLENGVLELMVHRRLLKDDAKGVGEALDDEEYGQGVVARGQHYLIIGPSTATASAKSTAYQERDLALKKLLMPLVMIGDTDMSLENVQDTFNFKFEALKTSVPDNIHILTLEPWKEDTYILRLEHILENGEDVNLSGPAILDLAETFSLFDFVEIKETTLGANQWIEEYLNRPKYDWNIKGDSIRINETSKILEEGKSVIVLDPMQIVTFIVKLAKK